MVAISEYIFNVADPANNRFSSLKSRYRLAILQFIHELCVTQRVTFSPTLSIKDSPAKSAAEKKDAKTNAKLNFFIFSFFKISLILHHHAMNVPITGILLSRQLRIVDAIKLQTATTTTHAGVGNIPLKYPTSGARTIMCIR